MSYRDARERKKEDHDLTCICTRQIQESDSNRTSKIDRRQVSQRHSRE